MGVSTLHASSIKGSAFEFARYRSCGMGLTYGVSCPLATDRPAVPRKTRRWHNAGKQTVRCCKCECSHAQDNRCSSRRRKPMRHGSFFTRRTASCVNNQGPTVFLPVLHVFGPASRGLDTIRGDCHRNVFWRHTARSMWPRRTTKPDLFFLWW